MATGYRPKIAGTSRGNTWGQQYGSHGNEEATGQMRLGIDFPYVCERCLGSNPYIQMIKSDFGASCKISKRPFHVFKWTNPETRRRMKTVKKHRKTKTVKKQVKPHFSLSRHFM